MSLKDLNNYYRKIEAESERIAMETIQIVKTDLDSKTKMLKEV